VSLVGSSLAHEPPRLVQRLPCHHPYVRKPVFIRQPKIAPHESAMRSLASAAWSDNRFASAAGSSTATGVASSRSGKAGLQASMDARQLTLQSTQLMSEARCWGAVAAASINAAGRSSFDAAAWANRSFDTAAGCCTATGVASSRSSKAGLQASMDARQLALQSTQLMSEARCWGAVAAASINAAGRSSFDAAAWANRSFDSAAGRCTATGVASSRSGKTSMQASMDARQLALQGAQVVSEARCRSAVAAIGSNLNAARRSRFDSAAWLGSTIATTMEQTRLCHAGTAEGKGEHRRKNKSTHGKISVHGKKGVTTFLNHLTGGPSKPACLTLLLLEATRAIRGRFG
jgi:hypothetical protein